MALCPVCGGWNEISAPACRKCGLASGLFQAVREVAGPDTDSQYASVIAELLAAAEPGMDGTHGPGPKGPSSSFFPTLPSRPSPIRGPSPPPLPVSDKLAGVDDLVSQYAALGRRLGLPVSDLEREVSLARKEASRSRLASARRRLFRLTSERLIELYGRLRNRRDELAYRVVTTKLDTCLENCRRALASGDLLGLEAAEQSAAAEIAGVEETWMNVVGLVAKVRSMGRTVRDLGGDPTEAVAPVARAFRAAKSGDVRQAEQVLGGTVGALWDMMMPLIARWMSRLRETTDRPGIPQTVLLPVAAELRRLSDTVHNNDHDGAVQAIRRLNRAVSGLPRPRRTS